MLLQDLFHVAASKNILYTLIRSKEAMTLKPFTDARNRVFSVAGALHCGTECGHSNFRLNS